MINLVESRIDEIAALARRHGVQRLELFGSATSQRFDTTHSDLDFLVQFVDAPPGGLAHAYFGLLQDLEGLFSRPVDLTIERSIRNPYFRKSVDESRQPVYAQ